ncbi:GTP cyclohydrolase I FolE [Helicobacter brantae]|uniref:GTP cyclohydrolase 1 n=1 Tax=Helicobacter brantae TaxID=375927 RepID=A0A3D8J233_9HELI|nr:GTP cyclohydrolase I FolE [Helicobacter brantae]RDU70914.1 GTP cyclohydrolase I FolE [Helicobacter brantae]
MYRDFFEKLCKSVGENPHREGLKNTPQRLEQSLGELLSGYHKEAKEVFHTTFCEIPYNEMIVIKNVEFYSMCEHHLLPFFGSITIGYIPQEKIAGISDFAKLIEMYARRLQTQENLTFEIIETLMRELSPKGAMLVCEATHLCMAMRGVEKKSSTLLTSAVRGIFKESSKTRAEFLEHIKKC